MSSAPHFGATLLTLCLTGCGDSVRLGVEEPGEALAGGTTTVWRGDVNAFAQPSANLSGERRVDFSAGNSFFRSPWVIAPATTIARDGLGPLFNSNACQNCHIKDGRGHPPEPDASSAVSMLVRVSIPDTAAQAHVIQRLGVNPEPVYGTQLQDMAIPGVAPEAKVRVEYDLVPVTFDDGTRVELRKPRLVLSQLGYGPLHPDARLSARVAPPMIGLGLLEAIPESALLANAEAQAAQADGVHGQPNWVWDGAQGRTVIGRFGWKAGQPTLAQQNAHAFANDLGLTTRQLPDAPCTAAQFECLVAPHGGAPEVSENIERLVLFYTRNVAVPARRDVNTPQVLAGKQLFHQAGCQTCHVPQYTTAADAAEPELANQRIRPYTDLLLHDMGPGLADQRSEFTATGQQWRTAPLWGMGLSEAVSGHTQYLHDGRARDAMEAILWHDGEANSSRRHVLSFNAGQRAALLAFLNSL
ncbi:di-heme oxidoredictase family protein [Pseudomonas eucalypticola]|uniref:C-type cytochrome n=1 Tax=Pseudomonas eucalypticola TaxID=2599595 RepID=A0A7D5H872_9PSED|nr:di-heme oxidoredictase family protein [Pseudomonas eucalypticola]QKZ06643.1 c-type cytochrome [Pseudomonas eucalypticola]